MKKELKILINIIIHKKKKILSKMVEDISLFWHNLIRNLLMNKLIRKTIWKQENKL